MTGRKAAPIREVASAGLEELEPVGKHRGHRRSRLGAQGGESVAEPRRPVIDLRIGAGLVSEHEGRHIRSFCAVTGDADRSTALSLRR